MTGTDERPDWEIAGEAWSHAPADWAYLFEPYARDAVETVYAELGVGSSTRLLDVACGAGMALSRAARLGASTAGLDAAAGLLEIAHRRSPSTEIVHGSMFALPWSDASFDAVVSFNGIWGGCDDAVAEMARVLRPGGGVGITFWGEPTRLDLLAYFVTLGSTAAPVQEEIVTLASIAGPGVAEAMAEKAGLVVRTRGTTTAVLELPDAEYAWRALRAPGLAVDALRAVGEDALRAAVLDAIEPFRAQDGSYRLENELVHVTMGATDG